MKAFERLFFLALGTQIVFSSAQVFTFRAERTTTIPTTSAKISTTPMTTGPTSTTPTTSTKISTTPMATGPTSTTPTTSTTPITTGPTSTTPTTSTKISTTPMATGPTSTTPTTSTTPIITGPTSTTPTTTSTTTTTPKTTNSTATTTTVVVPSMTPKTAISSTQTCQCVTTGYCEIAGGQSSTDGAGKLDMRISTFNSPVNQSGTTKQITTPASTGTTIVTTPPKTCDIRTESCCTTGYKCGLRYPPVSGSPNINNYFQTPYGSYPWQGMVFKNKTNITSGALIDQWHFLTTARLVQPYVKSPTSLKLRMGQWDMRNNSNQQLLFPFREFRVESIIIHPNYTENSSKNNIAILKLKKQVNLGEFPTIGTACLPSSPITGIRCWASGWSYQSGNTNLQDIQRQVDLPLIDPQTCQSQLRNTALGPKFILDNSSFICAGGEQGKDTCGGDPAAPLVCEVASQFYLTGLAAWGMDCAKKNIPGVYTNVQSYVPWIQATISSEVTNVVTYNKTTTVQGSTLKILISTTTLTTQTTFKNSTPMNMTTTSGKPTTLTSALTTPSTSKSTVTTKVTSKP